VNEEGTQAAAVTISGFEAVSLPEEFEVNRPFIFYIYDHVNHLQLFVGRVVDPNGIAKLKPTF